MNSTVKTAAALLFIVSLLSAALLAGWNRFFGTASASQAAAFLSAWTAHLVFAALSLLSGAALFFMYRKTTSVEIHLLLLSTFSLSAAALRYPLLPASGVSYLPVGAEMLARIVLFFYLFAIILFLFAGLFSNGLPQLRQNTLILTAVIAALTLSSLAVLPAGGILPHRASIHSFTGMIILGARVAEALAAMNFVAAARRNNNRQYLLPAAGLAGVFIGLELFLASPAPISALFGAVLYTASLIFYSRRLYTINLWN
jgi:hypothetical protein